jgi:hypothetical protein
MDDHPKQCHIIEIPRFTDDCGTLSVIEGKSLLPFEPKRFYYLYELIEGARRGCHAHRTEEELIIALAGGFKVTVDDGNTRREFPLERPDQGLYLPPLVWHEVHSFAAGSVCVVLASERYDIDDYYRVYEDFLQTVRKSQL